eukprot:s7270_g3.t1
MLEQQPDYDFHFSLRAIAKLKHAAVRSGKSCQNPSRSQTGRRKLRTFGVKELSRRVQKIKLQNLVDSLPGAGIDVLRGSKVSILQWSGETNLTVDMGCLMFIDAMNFCKAGLGKLIESHKRSALIAVNLRGQSEACGLERAFPLTASRHPFLKNARDPADEGWADAVFDCYLALDITAYADLMQIFRQHFFDTHHIDPFLYPSLPSASWEAVLRSITQRRGRRLRLVDVYKAVKNAMMGGLCAVFRPRSESNFEGMEGYDADQPIKRSLYLDINSMYPHAMTKHLPCSSGKQVPLPEDEAKMLAWLHEVLDGLSLHEDVWETTYLVFVDYDYPEDLHDALDFPSPCRLAVPPAEVPDAARDPSASAEKVGRNKIVVPVEGSPLHGGSPPLKLAVSSAELGLLHSST